MTAVILIQVLTRTDDSEKIILDHPSGAGAMDLTSNNLNRFTATLSKGAPKIIIELEQADKD